MASLFSHILVGATTVKASDTFTTSRSSLKLFFISMFCSAMPDLDIIAFRFGIPYSHWLGHRGLSHSLFFALIWGILMAFLFFRNGDRGSGFWKVALILCISTALHGALDAVTNGGRGVGFFIPFDNSRYFFPFRPVQVSPLGVDGFFSEWGLRVIYSEFIWLMLPCLIFWWLLDQRSEQRPLS